MPERKDARGHTIEWKPDTSQSKITQIANYDDGEVVCIEFLDENRVRLRIRGDATQVEGGGDNGHS
jgi:hypothetical protein